ncbi:MAG: PDZ domain-containing protein [Candidatus Pacebacteria bacterium]|nr:PDZ domain-containing protein [Candidatus Paceibacterota bacterium]
MKLKLSTLSNFIAAGLLVVLGAVLGYRYASTGTLPLGIKLPFVERQLASSSTLSKLVGQLEAPEEKEVDFTVFWEVWSLLERDYLEPEEMSATEMVNGAISGMTSAIGDPYTIYLPPDDNKRSGENLSGSFYGIGIELGYIDDTLAVVSPLDGTPADKAGLQAGDLILHIKDKGKGLDEDTAGWSLTEAVDHIRGKRGTDITLTIYREGKEEPFQVTVTRDEIVVETVKLEFRQEGDKRIAYLRLNRFGGRTQQEWDMAVNSIVASRNSLDGLVLDLRNNPGGYFDTSIDIASDFIDKGVVVTQKGKYSEKDYTTTNSTRLTGIETVILVNKGSASAAEIVAGALRDQLGFKLVGTRTFGKGTVQDRRDISNGGGLHITVGRWLLPSGQWIHDEGIAVDIEVEQDLETQEDEVYLRAIQEF